MKLSLITFLLAGGMAAFAVACGGSGSGDGNDVSEADWTQARITPAELELDSQPHATPSACDVHTHLSLKNEDGSTATLTEIVGGLCRLAVPANARTYRLRYTKSDCGSRIYTGAIENDDGDEVRSIKITDHRTRTCEDVVPAAVIVEETAPDPTSGDPVTTTKYSRDPAPEAGSSITLSGTLVHTSGIGGENTGSSIETTDQGTIELILDTSESYQFREGKTARVTGTVKYISGVETHDRKAVDVSEILVCPDPGTISCKPSYVVRLSNLCAPDIRDWASASCTGVTFTD